MNLNEIEEWFIAQAKVMNSILLEEWLRNNFKILHMREDSHSAMNDQACPIDGRDL